MPKLSVPATLNFLHARTHAVSRIIRLVAASAALVALGSLSTMVMLGPKPADAAGDAAHPRIFRIPLDTPLTERAVYPPGIAVGSFDGAYTIATMYKSGVFAGNKVALWGSEAGALKAGSYPLDEFVYVMEGDLVTVDADGTRHEFHPGDAFVIPKGWAGTWDMKTRFKKIIVNF
jgi:uncharacterized cupin superfamily protein